MPTVRLPEESEHSEMVRKIDAMLRGITKAPAMTQSVRAQGLGPSILMVRSTSSRTPSLRSRMWRRCGRSRSRRRFCRSLANSALYSVGHRADTLKRLGMTNEQLFEATTAVTVFAKNAAFSTGLQLEPVTT